jgi:hypothetical protein
MNKTLKTSLVALWLLAFGFAITSSVNAQQSPDQEEIGDVYLTVDAWELTIWTSGATLNLGNTGAWGTLSGQFSADSFYVSDLKWAESGYYTTIQVTDLTGSINGITKTIPAENVSFKAGQASPDLITGDANTGVVFVAAVSDYVAIDNAVQYIKRDNNGGILWVYGDAPRVKVEIPAYTPATDYHGVITYTLYENE